MRIRFLFLFVFLCGLLAGAASGQSISPLVAECSAKKCVGQFTITNNGIVSLAVDITPYGVTFDSTNKNPVLHALDASEHVQLAEMSARIPPRQPHDFGYSIRCDVRPCLIALAAGMVVGHVESGMQAKIILVHAIYLCDKAAHCRESVRKAAGL